MGDRVRYVGLSVQVAERGEAGIIIDLVPGGRSRGMFEVLWDLGVTTSYCWPAELEAER